MPVKNRLLQGTFLQPYALEATLWHIPEVNLGHLVASVTKNAPLWLRNYLQTPSVTKNPGFWLPIAGQPNLEGGGDCRSGPAMTSVAGNDERGRLKTVNILVDTNGIIRQ